MANMSAEILRNIVAQCFSVDPCNVNLSGRMPARYSVQACSTGGELYSHDENVTIWGYNPKKGFIKIPDILVEEKARQNANGSWANAYGYTAEHLHTQMPEAVFFIQNFVLDRKTERQEPQYENSWVVFAPPRKIRK